jgi:hypothetical protein
MKPCAVINYNHQSSKVLKGSWTHYPGSETIVHSAERLAAGVSLLDKVRSSKHVCMTLYKLITSQFEDRLMNAYKHVSQYV